MKIYKESGELADWAWVQSVFGKVRVVGGEKAYEPGFVVAELRESTNEAAVLVTVPEPGIGVARWWPDPELPKLPADFQHFTQGVWGPAEAQDRSGLATVGFGMGKGDAYDPRSKSGASAVWCRGNSEAVTGLGWVAGTHYRHLNVVFRYLDIGSPSASMSPSPSPEPDVALELLEEIEEQARCAFSDLVVLDIKIRQLRGATHMKAGDRVLDSRTGNWFIIIAVEEPTRRTPSGRFRLDDGHWRDGQEFLARYTAEGEVRDGLRAVADNDGDTTPSVGEGLDSGSPDPDIHGTEHEGEDSEGE